MQNKIQEILSTGIIGNGDLNKIVDLIDDGIKWDFEIPKELVYVEVSLDYDYNKIFSNGKYNKLKNLIIDKMGSFGYPEIDFKFIRFVEEQPIELVDRLLNYGNSYVARFRDYILSNGSITQKLIKKIKQLQFNNLYEVIGLSAIFGVKLDDKLVNKNDLRIEMNTVFSSKEFDFINQNFGIDGLKVFYGQSIIPLWEGIDISQEMFDFIFDNAESFRESVIKGMIICDYEELEFINLFTQQHAIKLFKSGEFELHTIKDLQNFNDPIKLLLENNQDWKDFESLVQPEPENIV